MLPGSDRAVASEHTNGGNFVSRRPRPAGWFTVHRLFDIARHGVSMIIVVKARNATLKTPNGDTFDVDGDVVLVGGTRVSVASG